MELDKSIAAVAKGLYAVVLFCIQMQSIKEVLSKDQVGKKVGVRGWIYRTRSSGGIVFAVLRDSTGLVQVTVKKGAVPDADFESSTKAGSELAVELEAGGVESKGGHGGI